MATLEGARRIQIVGKWIILIGCTVVAIFWLFLGRSVYSLAGLVFFLPFFLPPVVLGGILWAAGWIIEGFQKPSSRD